MTSAPTSRIISENAHKYYNKTVTMVGEVTSITPHANTLSIRLAEDDNAVVLLPKNPPPVELNLLTEVTGKLVSRGQIEATHVKQFSPKETARFNKALYVEAMQVMEAHRQHIEV